jgi:DUF4097 and DUF4098 domain-containing protein YvlB
VIIILLYGVVSAVERIETFTFENIHSIKIETISGDINILPGGEDKLMVELENYLDDPDLLDPEVEADDGELSIEEYFIGRNTSGEIQWTIFLPKSVNLRSVECESASGEILLEDFSVDFINTNSASVRTSVNSIGAKELDISTASGSISIEDCGADFVKANSASGGVSAKSVEAEEIDLSTASGGVSLRDCQADYIKSSSASGRISASSINTKEMECSNASGRIMVEDVEIDEEGEMSSASGDVELILHHLPKERFEASSASGDVILEVPYFGENFSMILMKRADKGKIKCPFEYTEKETVRLNRGDHYLTDRYLVKRGKGGPEIRLSTASGSIRIKTNTRRK